MGHDSEWITFASKCACIESLGNENFGAPQEDNMSHGSIEPAADARLAFAPSENIKPHALGQPFLGLSGRLQRFPKSSRVSPCFSKQNVAGGRDGLNLLQNALIFVRFATFLEGLT